MRVLILTMMYPRPGYPNFGIFIQKQALAISRSCHVRVIAALSFFKAKYFFPSGQDAFVVSYIRYIAPPGSHLFGLKLALVAARILVAAWPIRPIFRFDVIHAHGASVAGFVGVILARLARSRCVITVHSDEFRGVGSKLAWGMARNFALRRASRVVAVSSRVARDLVDHGVPPWRILLVPNGVDDAWADYAARGAKPPGEIKNVLSVGRLSAQKGQLDVLKALAEILMRRPAFRVVYTIVGAGPMEKLLRKTSLELGLENIVRFVGEVRNEDLLPYYAEADVFALPSSSEGFGVVYLEALTFGVPVIACAGQGPEDFVKDGVNGFLVPSESIMILADKLEEAVDIQWDRNVIRRTVAQYRWTEVAERLVHECYLPARAPRVDRDY